MGILIRVNLIVLKSSDGAHWALNWRVNILWADPGWYANTMSNIFSVGPVSHLIRPATAAIWALVATVLGWPGWEPSLRLVKPSISTCSLHPCGKGAH